MSNHTDGIALIGLAARLPGAADAARFWDNLRTGHEAVRFPSDEELLAAGVPASMLADSGYVKAVAETPELEMFDADFFGFTPRDATLLDPQIRLFLEVGHTAVEDAGYDPARIADGAGVFGAVGVNRYLDLHVRRPTGYEANSSGNAALSTLSHPDYAATHLAYRFGFRGPALTVSTACSSSAVAVHLACQALRTGECDIAVAAGSEVEMPAHSGYLWDPGGPLSPDGHVRPFDHRAAGTVFGTGAGAVVLKRLDDALADGDRVRAVIRASAMSNDGAAKAGFTTPGVSGQVQAVREAMVLAGVEAPDVSFIEAHATGTPLGDPIEVTALAQAHRPLGADRIDSPIVLGSVKGNIGHLGHASGIASLIKLVLCIEHEQLVPTVNFAEPNPRLSLDTTPFVIGDRTTPWPRDAARPRIAGLSSFGFGGTNVHLVVQEGPPVRHSPAARRPQVIVLSARTPEAARVYQERAAAALDGAGAGQYADTAGVLQDGRTRHAARSAVVARDAAEAARTLPAAPIRTGDALPVIFAFPGQAAQYPAMAADLHGADPVFTEAMDTCLEAFAQHGVRLEGHWRDPDASALADTTVAQPLLFSVEFALAEMWRSWGITPAGVLGHSIGELTAGAVAGVFDLPDAVRLVCARAEAMAAMPPGGLVAVSAGAEEVSGLLPDEVSVAVVNGPRQVVLASPADRLDEVQALLRERRLNFRLLPVPHAFHSPHMAQAATKFDLAFADVRSHEPAVPVFSSAAGGPAGAETGLARFWSDQLVRPVRFDLAVDHLLGGNDRLLLEVGPGHTLTRLAREHRAVRAGTSGAVATLPARAGDDELLSVLEAAAALWTEGHELNWAAVRQREAFHRLPAPTYPYRRSRHWLPLRGTVPDRTPEEGGEGTVAPEPEDVAAGHDGVTPFTTATWVEEPRPANRRTGAGAPAVAVVPADHEASLPVLLALRQAGYRPVVVRPGAAFAEEGEEFRVRLDRPEQFGNVLTALADRGKRPALLVHALSMAVLDRPSRTNLDEQLDSTLHSLVALVQHGGRHSPEADLLVLAGRSVDLTGAEPLDPAKAALHGAVRSLAMETPDLTCRLVDVSDPVREEDLAAEITATGTDRVVALRGPGRWVRTDRLYTPDAPAAPAVRRGGVYVLTGGLGDLGLAVAGALADTGLRPHLVLLGRHGIAADDERRRARVAALEAAGATVSVEECDVGDHRSMRRVLDILRTRHGAVHGIVHLAGVAGGGTLLGRDRDDTAAVLWPKAMGTVVLAELLADQPPLDFFVTFSSRAAVDGLLGGADYAAANAFADAQSRLMARAGIPAVSLNWPAWHTVGMAVRPEPAPEGSRTWSAVLDPREHPVLDEHRIDGVPVLPGTGHLDLVVRAYREVIEPHAGPLRLTDVVFQRPLPVPEARQVEVLFRPDGPGWRFAVGSTPATGAGGENVRYATGCVVSMDADEIATPPGPGASLQNLRERLTAPSPDHGEEDHPRLFAVGPRWDIVRGVTTGPDHGDELLIELALPEAFQPDLDVHPLHPAVLDCATSAVRRPATDGLSLPFGYESLELHADLPAESVSHIRRRPSGAGLIVADIDLYTAGGSLVARIAGFSMRQVIDGTFLPDEGPVDGIAPEHGGALFLSLLGTRHPYQVSVRPHVNGVPVRTTVIAGAPTLPPPRVTEPGAPTPSSRVAAPVAAPAATPVAAAVTSGSVRDRLAALWERVLGIAPSGELADFFELGGNSLSAVELMSEIRAEFGIRTGIVTLFDHPTLGALAEIIAAEGAAT
ncbi:type I polyketide synthase [Actinomadura madurae]|uniref:type I polyketide synthase n=1 Tax=Actinomadura madurae TaxID=1993 RepID=UPI000D820BA9|nr:type I polyketide synthase [Actinomadura madurae]SPT57301.1 Beta-ketoacyl-acyl-carrier-protein synthase I [Actinomadura madurae]